LNSGWVTNITGNPAHDDDIWYISPLEMSRSSSKLLTTALSNYIGTGNLAMIANADANHSLQGGGGNIVFDLKTKYKTEVTVTYYYCPAAKVGNYVWTDTDGDGTQDGGETGINGVTVELYKETAPSSGSYALAQTTTTANNGTNDGAYNFVITESANYYVHFPTTNGVNVLSPATTTAATDGNSDANVSTGNSPIFAMDVNGTGTAKDNQTIDAGFKGIGSVGNFVWADTDGDGTQDVGETGINGVTVELYKETSAGSGSYTLAQTTTTSNNGTNDGAYNFVITESANYYVHFPTTNGVNVLSPATTTAATDGNSDANVSTGNSPIFAIDINGTGTSKDNSTIDAGFKGIGSVGNFVWNDTDGDGTQDVGETGINGVTVELYKETSAGSGSYTLAQTTTTAANAGNAGYYNFVITESANYYVHFPLVSGVDILTIQTSTAATNGNSDANISTGNSPVFAIDINGTGTAKDNPTIDAGYTPVSSTVGDYVWLDIDKDGFQDATERGVSGVVVSLINSSNQIVATMLTDAYGYYLFRNVLAGDYKVRFSLPISYGFTVQESSPSATGSDANVSTGFTNTFHVNAGDNITTIDAGIYFDKILRGGLGNFVWLDNGNGRQDAGELGVANVAVMLYNTSGTQLQATLTNSSGYYQFMDLAPGNYVVGVRLPLGYQFVNANQGGNDNLDSDILPNTGKTGTIVLPPNTFDQSNDAGIVAIASTQASIGDYVWNDANKNGLQDTDEVGVSNLIVELWDDIGTLVSTTRTDAYGYYMFTDVVPGFYAIKFELPAGWAFSNPNIGGNDNFDSDVTTLIGGTDTFQVYEGDRITTIDAGVYNPSATSKAVIGDYVWYDLDKDGVQDATESGVAGVTVVLYDGNFAIARTTTDANGKYLFIDLPVGTYSVGFSNLPIGYAFSSAAQGADATLDSDVSPSTGKTSAVTLTSNAINLDLDAGIYPTNRSEGYASLGDRVWYDTNNNGLQDGEEVGAANVTVRLYDATNTEIASMETNGSGLYLFSGLDAGVYYVQFDLPSGYSFSAQNQGANDNLDSDAGVSGLTATITLGTSENNFSIDAGLYKNAATASIGDFVWHDANSDGIQNNGEKGVPGVSVTLYNQLGVFITTTVTDKNGYYLFPFLTAGTYSIIFNNFPQIFSLATQGQGGDSNLDSDPDPVTGRTPSFTLANGQSKTDIDAGLYSARATLGDYVWNDVNANGLQDINEPSVSGVTVHLFNSSNQYLSSAVTDASGYYLFFNLTPGSYYINVSDLPIQTVFTIQNAGDDGLDSDINPATALSQTVTLAANDLNKTVDAGLNMNANASLEGYVWFDSNGDGLQTSGEVPVAGVLAILETPSGIILSRTITSGEGMYHFENVVPGAYKVRFTNIPAGSRFTASDINGGNDDRLDSDADAITGLSTSAYTVASGQRLHAADAGLLPPASVGGTAFEDAGNAPNGLQDPTEITFFNVIVMLYTADSTLVGQTTTDKNGNYLFTGLYPDNYFVVFGTLGSRSFTGKDIDNNVTDDLDSDVNFSGGTDIFSLTIGEDKRNIDAGYLEPGFIFPVTMAYFTAELVNTDGLLKWRTTSEVNTEHFEVYRSLDEFSYEKIGDNVTAKGSPTTSQNYSTFDYNVNKLNVDRVFYKLKIMDFDGKITESNVVVLNLTHTNQAIFAQVYPNPAETMIWVDYQLFDGKTADLKITNSLGQAMFTQTIKASETLQQISFDISAWADGVYYLNIQSENSNFVRKIIKE
jgi:protocatechuate 3,4-dioxygenase beta subunit